MQLIGGDDAVIQTAATGAQALALLKGGEGAEGAPPATAFDVAVVSIDLSDTKGFDLIDEIRESLQLTELPLVLYSNRSLSKKEELHVKRLTQTTPLKDVRSQRNLIQPTCSSSASMASSIRTRFRMC